jgi:hypothetical protein
MDWSGTGRSLGSLVLDGFVNGKGKARFCAFRNSGM